MAPIRALVTDLDGTFWSGHEVVHPTTLAAVEEVRRRGVELLVATGRRRQSVLRGLGPHGLSGEAVLLSGSLGVDLDSGEEWHRAGFDADQAVAVLETFRRCGAEPVLYVGSREVDAVAGDDCTTHPEHVTSFGDTLTRAAPDAWCEAGQAVAFGIIGGSDGDGLAQVADELDGIANAWLQVDEAYGGWTLMVSPADITKVTGVAPWCERRGYAPDEVLAVGDGANDVDLLAWAGTAVAVAGSHASTAPHDATIARPEDGGWATLLDLL